MRSKFRERMWIFRPEPRRMALCALIVFGFGSSHANDHDAAFEPLLDSDSSNLNIMFVHGMNCHNPGYSDAFQFRLARALGNMKESGTLDTYYYNLDDEQF